MSDDTETGLATTIADGPGPEETGEIPTMIDRFIIEDEIGAGGMGRVYLAYDPSLDRKVAVKVLLERALVDKAKATARMAREARAMAKLRHPNVVTIYEVGAPPAGGVYLVMEYAPGGTLRDWLARDPTWQQIVQMYTYAGRGLAAAHDAGLVHRDFKPDNVLVGEDGRVQVTDFGIANVDGEQPAGDAGTPAYMSPEREVDARSDQFAFCAALYEALFGVRPFAGKTFAEISEHARRGSITPPLRDRAVPAEVRQAIERGLRADPAERFPSMDALLSAIAAPQPKSRAWIAIAALAMIAGVVLVFATRGTSAAKPDGLVAIESFELQLADHGGRWEWREGIGDVIAIALAEFDGFKAIGPTKLLGPEAAREARAQSTRPEFRALEVKAGAAYTVRGKLEDRGGRLEAHVVVERADGSIVVEIERVVVSSELWPLVDDLALAIAEGIAPGTRPPPGTTRARTLQAVGDEYLRNTEFQMARPFLEQAVLADPTYFEGWYSLMLVRTWVLAPESQVFDALDTAATLAPSPLDKRLVEGIGVYLHHDLPKARGVLEALIAEPTLGKQARRDALYFLGEAHWHDGHHRATTTYFKQALDLDFRFKLPISHLNEYATANRDIAMLNQYAPLISSSTRDYRDTAEFIAGNYEPLANDSASPMHFAALSVLGRQPSAGDEAAWEVRNSPDFPIYRAAAALAANDAARAKREIEKVWAWIESQSELGDSQYYVLRLLGDTLLAAGDLDEVKRLIGFLAARSKEHPVRSYQRLSILAAGLLGDRSLIDRRELSGRDATLADAIEAELAGDRAKAVTLLDQLIKDPSPYWEYPERVALLRNFEALKRTADARALCADTLRPAIFQWAFLPTRRACQHAM